MAYRTASAIATGRTAKLPQRFVAGTVATSSYGTRVLWTLLTASIVVVVFARVVAQLQAPALAMLACLLVGPVLYVSAARSVASNDPSKRKLALVDHNGVQLQHGRTLVRLRWSELSQASQSQNSDGTWDVQVHPRAGRSLEGHRLGPLSHDDARAMCTLINDETQRRELLSLTAQLREGVELTIDRALVTKKGLHCEHQFVPWTSVLQIEASDNALVLWTALDPPMGRIQLHSDDALMMASALRDAFGIAASTRGGLRVDAGGVAREAEPVDETASSLDVALRAPIAALPQDADE